MGETLYRLPLSVLPDTFGPLAGRRWVLGGIAPVDVDVLGQALARLRIDQPFYAPSLGLLAALWGAMEELGAAATRTGTHGQRALWGVGDDRVWAVDARWTDLGGDLPVEVWGTESARRQPDGWLVPGPGVSQGGLRWRDPEGRVVGLLVGLSLDAVACDAISRAQTGKRREPIGEPQGRGREVSAEAQGSDVGVTSRSTSLPRSPPQGSDSALPRPSALPTSGEEGSDDR